MVRPVNSFALFIDAFLWLKGVVTPLNKFVRAPLHGQTSKPKDSKFKASEVSKAVALDPCFNRTCKDYNDLELREDKSTNQKVPYDSDRDDSSHEEDYESQITVCR